MKYFSIIVFVTILFTALYFSKSLDKKDSSEAKEKKGKKKIEDEISQSLKEEIKDASTTEAKEKIERAVRNQGYLEEDWQIDSAVERIKDKLERNNKKVGRDSKEESTTKTSTSLFYGSDWKEAGFTIISSPQYFDILVTDNKVYVIKIPKTQWRLVGLIFGFSLGPLGALLGAFIGHMIDESKRKAKRKTWMDDDCKIKSKKYKSYIFFEFSKKKIREKIDFQEKKTVKIGYDGKAINLKTKKGNCKELKEFVYS